jgi:hypothetical protein
MAVGLDSAGSEFVLYVPDASNKSRQSSSGKNLTRLGLVAGSIVLVALVGFAATTFNSKSVMLDAKNAATLKGAKASDTLAATILTSVLHSSPKKLMQILRTWKDNQISNLDSFDSKQMLRQTKSVTTILEDSASGICASKTVILDKLNGLSSQVLAELENLNATDAAKLQSSTDAHQAWLDTESEYRLMEQKHDQAKEGAKYASEKYEKWAEAVTATEDRYKKLSAELEAAKISDGQEKALLQSIVDTLAKAKSLKAGDASVEMKEVEAKINLLKQVADKAKQAKLAAFAAGRLTPAKLTGLLQSGEIADLIQGFITQIDDRLAALGASVDSASADLAAHKVKLAKFQQDVVDLSNAADKASNEAMVADLKRQNLAGIKVTEEEDYAAEHADYALTYPPLQQELLILQTVISKVESICA